MSRTCSQLSNTSNRTLPSKAAATDSAHALPRLLGDAQHGRHRIRHRTRISQRGKLENPYPVDKFVDQPRRDFHRKARLADATDAGQRHEPM